jgi:hypothetical protein
MDNPNKDTLEPVGALKKVLPTVIYCNIMLFPKHFVFCVFVFARP